jgi:hypothetical protein
MLEREGAIATLLERTEHILKVLAEIRKTQEADSGRIRQLEDRHLEMKVYQRVVMGIVSFGSALAGFALNAWRQ